MILPSSPSAAIFIARLVSSYMAVSSVVSVTEARRSASKCIKSRLRLQTLMFWSCRCRIEARSAEDPCRSRMTVLGCLHHGKASSHRCQDRHDRGQQIMFNSSRDSAPSVGSTCRLMPQISSTSSCCLPSAADERKIISKVSSQRQNSSIATSDN